MYPLTMVAGQHAQLVAILVLVQTNDAHLVRHRQLAKLDSRDRLEGAARQPMAMHAASIAHTFDNHETDHNDEAQRDEYGEGQQQMGVDVERHVVVEHQEHFVRVLVLGAQRFAGPFGHKDAGNENVVAVLGRHWFCVQQKKNKIN